MLYTKVKRGVVPEMVRDGFGADGIALWVAILSHDNMNSAGIFRLPKMYMCGDLDWSMERLQEPFQELLDKGYIEYDEDSKVVLVNNYTKYHPPCNDNQQKNVVKNLKMLPDTPLYEKYYKILKQYEETGNHDFSRILEYLEQRLGKGFDKGLPKGCQKGTRNNDNDTDNDTDTDKEKGYINSLKNKSAHVPNDDSDAKEEKTTPPPSNDINLPNNTDVNLPEIPGETTGGANIPYDKIKQAFLDIANTQKGLNIAVTPPEEREKIQNFWVAARKTAAKLDRYSDQWDVIEEIFENSQDTFVEDGFGFGQAVNPKNFNALLTGEYKNEDKKAEKEIGL